MGQTLHPMSQSAQSLSPQERHDLTLAAKALADGLGETKREARDAITRLVLSCGATFTSDLYRRTLDVEKDGGLLTGEGKRRTVGGVFFHLAKQTLGKDAYHAIVPPQWKVARDKRLAAKQRLGAGKAESTGNDQAEPAKAGGGCVNASLSLSARLQHDPVGAPQRA